MYSGSTKAITLYNIKQQLNSGTESIFCHLSDDN